MTWLAWGALALPAAYFSAVLWLAARAVATVDSLRALPVPALARWPRLSLVTPARDEAAALEGALRSRLAKDEVGQRTR